MSMVLSVLMSCLLSTSSVPSVVAAGSQASGECTGSYIDKASGNLVGAWSMQVAFVQDTKRQGGIRAIKTAGSVVLPRKEKDAEGMAELEISTLTLISSAVEKHVATPIGVNDLRPLVF